MSATTDPPSVERKRAAVWMRVRKFSRRLVNRRTLMAGLKVVFWTARIVHLIRRMVSDL